MARLYVVTHAQTKTNEAGRQHGWLDDPLSPAGHGEAQALGKQFSKVPVDVIASADFSRTVATAREISKSTGAPIVAIDPSFRTWHIGHLTGNTKSEAEGTLAQHMESTPDKQIPEGESFNDFKSRLLTGVSQLLQKQPNKNIVLVTSKTPERAIAAWISAGQKPDMSIDMNEMKKESDNPTVATYERNSPQTAAPEMNSQRPSAQIGATA